MKICVPLKIGQPKKLLKEFVAAQSKADLTEVWFEEIKKLDEKFLLEFFKKKKKPIIYKFQSNEKYFDKILKYGVDYVDVDINMPLKIRKHAKTKLIISYHNYKNTPPNKVLKSIVAKMAKRGADIIKLACLAKDFSDSMRMLQILEELVSQNKKAIFICMGKHGSITRIAGHLFGNYLMYAPLRPSGKTAQGQLTLNQLKKIIN